MTTDSKVLNSMLNALELTDGAFKTNIDKLFKMSIKIANRSKEFQEEVRLYGDLLFHLYLKDIDFNIWIHSSHGNLTYNTSFYEPESDKTRAIHFILNKKVLKKIFTKDLDAAEAYMKGLLEFDGSFSDAMIAKNLIKTYFQYLKFF